MKEELVTHIPADQVFCLLLEHLSNRLDLEIGQCHAPSLIEVRICTYLADNPFNVRIELGSEKTRTLVSLNFDFTITYILCFFLWAIMQALMIAMFGMSDTLLLGSWTTAMVLEGGLYLSTRRTKKNFAKELAPVILAYPKIAKDQERGLVKPRSPALRTQACC